MRRRPSPADLAVARWQVPRGRDKVVLRDSTVRGLSLVIGRATQRWCFEYKIPLPAGGWSGGRRLVLGDLADMDIETARAAALAAKKQVSAGIDPAVDHIKPRLARPTLKAAAAAKARAARGGAAAEPAVDDGAEPSTRRRRTQRGEAA